MKTAEPLVSVVIPVFNGETFLADAIRSVLVQSYPNIECIVVDDGSTDGSAEIARGFGDHVRYVYKVNGGVASARNRGTEVARGDHVAFLDADDLWLTDKIERQVGALRSRPGLGLVYTGLQVVDENLEPVGELEAPAPEVALRNSLLLEPPVMSVAQTSLLPARVFHEIGGFDERLTTSADTDLACRVASRYLVEGVPEHLVLYRQHEGQMHHDATAMERDMLLVFEKLFGDPRLSEEVRRLKGRAYGNLYATLAAARLHEGDRAGFFSCLLKSLRHSPTSAARAGWHKVARTVRGS